MGTAPEGGIVKGFIVWMNHYEDGYHLQWMFYEKDVLTWNSSFVLPSPESFFDVFTLFYVIVGGHKKHWIVNIVLKEKP